jgi:hypothetical protein
MFNQPAPPGHDNREFREKKRRGADVRRHETITRKHAPVPRRHGGGTRMGAPSSWRAI